MRLAQGSNDEVALCALGLLNSLAGHGWAVAQLLQDAEFFPFLLSVDQLPTTRHAEWRVAIAQQIVHHSSPGPSQVLPKQLVEQVTQLAKASPHALMRPRGGAQARVMDPALEGAM